MLAKVGFLALNKDRSLTILYNDHNTQQIDVLAVDNESILVVECKACIGEPTKGNFKETIEAIGGKKEGLTKALRKIFPDSKHKIKFVFATKNYYLTQPDKDRLEQFDILHFDEESLVYYQDLQKHLGLAARFQLLGNIFAGQTIPEMNNKVPAIRGKMGGYTYYSFSIEPENLLKVGYVLHRNKANKKLMPTYQRLIKKSRLTAIQNFIESSGFFPNSLVINIESDKQINFDVATPQVETSISKIGILHLPKTYRSVYIIDGQHRLYGYANSEYRLTNSIPVVAFINLNRTEQVRMFMQINENQKAVPKNLQNTLNADLLWNSPELEERVKAIKLQIAQDLGEDLDSPLYDRVIIGENLKSHTRCITIDTIKIGLDRSSFFGTVLKNSLKKEGSFLVGDTGKCYEKLLPFMKESFRYLKDSLPKEWERGEESEGIITINAGIESFIRLFSDIIDYLFTDHKLNPRLVDSETVVKELSFYLDHVINFFKEIKPEERIDFRKSYG
ncbi:MAG TPA: hypothetical protein DIT07_02200, partial [Sphingobacteriaceae bacterium]|nr:hypothetical protein [Sphingobacteriaceae bacterium]